MYQHKCESICTCDCFTVCYDSWRFTGFLFSMLPSSTSTHSSAIIQIILYPRACVAHGRVHYANCIFIPYTYRVFFILFGQTYAWCPAALPTVMIIVFWALVSFPFGPACFHNLFYPGAFGSEGFQRNILYRCCVTFCHLCFKLPPNTSQS